MCAHAQAETEGGSLPLATVQRYQLLQALADLLPPSAKAAHEAEVLARCHTEQLLPDVLKQVRGSFVCVRGWVATGNRGEGRPGSWVSGERGAG